MCSDLFLLELLAGRQDPRDWNLALTGGDLLERWLTIRAFCASAVGYRLDSEICPEATGGSEGNTTLNILES